MVPITNPICVIEGCHLRTKRGKGPRRKLRLGLRHMMIVRGEGTKYRKAAVGSVAPDNLLRRAPAGKGHRRFCQGGGLLRNHAMCLSLGCRSIRAKPRHSQPHYSLFERGAGRQSPLAGFIPGSRVMRQGRRASRRQAEAGPLTGCRTVCALPQRVRAL